MDSEAQPQPGPVFRPVSVEGLDAAAAASAKSEVRRLLELIQQFGTGLRSPVDISIELTTDMAATVNRFNAKHGIQAPAYDRSRPQGTSCGITLTVPGDTDVIHYVIVMDAALWSEQSPGHLVYRTQGLASLLGYIINRHDSDRAQPNPPDFEGEFSESLWRSAWNLCKMYDNSIFALNLCNQFLRDQDGKPPVLADYFGDLNLLNVSELLDQLCVFATLDVQIYRVMAIGLDDLYPTAASFAGGLLQTLVELVVQFGSCDRLDELHERLSRMNGFPEFLEPVWPDVIAGCISEDLASKIQGFITAITTLFDRLGLRIEDMENGELYVHVHEPVACTWKEGEELSPR